MKLILLFSFFLHRCEKYTRFWPKIKIGRKKNKEEKIGKKLIKKLEKLETFKKKKEKKWEKIKKLKH